MGRHLKDFVCIFLFISIRHFAPHSSKRLIVRNVWLDKAKHPLNSLVGIVGMSRTLKQKEFEWSPEELWKNLWTGAAAGAAVLLMENRSSSSEVKHENTHQGKSQTTCTIVIWTERVSIFHQLYVFSFLFGFPCHTVVLIWAAVNDSSSTHYLCLTIGHINIQTFNTDQNVSSNGFKWKQSMSGEGN